MLHTPINHHTAQLTTIYSIFADEKLAQQNISQLCLGKIKVNVMITGQSR